MCEVKHAEQPIGVSRSPSTPFDVLAPGDTRRSRNPLYDIWKSMLARCYVPSHRSFKYYGARGITVCDSWRFDFAAFVADMGPRPDGLTLERKDNNGDYEPGNCRWATHTDQNKNRRHPKSRAPVLTSVRHLKISAGAGDPNSMPACQLDVLISAEALYDAQVSGDYAVIEKQEERLERAVRRLRAARIAWAKNLGELHPSAAS